MSKETAGFTLLEVLMALTLSAVLLVAALAHIISLANIWAVSDSDDFFRQHVDGVTLFLSNSFARSEGMENEEEGEPVVWGRPPGYTEFDPPLLTFSLKESPPLLVWEERTLPGITAHLFHNTRGELTLIWHSRHSDLEEEDEVRQTQISTFVKKIEYCYYDTEGKQWEMFDRPEEDRDGQYLLPDFIKLHFQYEEETYVSPILIPQRGHNVPIY